MLRIDELMVDYFARVIMSHGDAELVLQSVDETSDEFVQAIAERICVLYAKEILASIRENNHERNEM